MASERMRLMASSFKYTMISLYLDSPGIGEFDLETIEDNLVNRHFAKNGSLLFTKSDILTNVADIIKELRDQGVIIGRLGSRYEIVNIEEVMNSDKRASENHFVNPRQKSNWEYTRTEDGEYILKVD